MVFIHQDFAFLPMGGTKVSVLASSAVDGGFMPRSGQTKEYKIGICCFSAKHAALTRIACGGHVKEKEQRIIFYMKF